MYELLGIEYLFVKYFKLSILAVIFFYLSFATIFYFPRVYLVYVRAYFYSVHVIIWREKKKLY